MRRQPAVFLDRDGVINQDSDFYVKSWEEFSFLPGSLEALKILHEAGCEVYIVTNQAGIGKGVYPERNCRDILLRLKLQVRRAGGMLHGVAVCPHRRDEACACRKPKPGMLLRLATKWGLDPARSVLVGDSCTDMDAAYAAGCATVFLHTRPPEKAAEHRQRCTCAPDYEAPDLLTALPDVLAILHRSAR